jgi:hypothetical protein
VVALFRNPYRGAVDDQDAANYQDLLDALSKIDPWLARIDPRASRPGPQTASPMLGDDNRLKPYHMSHASWAALSHAVDHLSCLRSVVRDAGVVHMYAPYTLVRAALENASTSVWLLAPPGRPQRLTRRLRLAVRDINYGEDAKAITGEAGPRTREERIEGVRAIARTCGLDETAATRSAGYKEIIKAVGDDSQVTLLAWNACSGIAHGDFWTTPAVMRMVPIAGGSTDVGTFSLSANVGLLAKFTTLAVQMTNNGWQLYDQRSRQP